MAACPITRSKAEMTRRKAIQGFTRIGGGASAEYVIWRAGLNYQRLLPADWTCASPPMHRPHAMLWSQASSSGWAAPTACAESTNALTRTTKDIRQPLNSLHPTSLSKLGFNGGRLKFLAFYDTGNLSRNFIEPGEQTGLGVDSMGIGMRMTFPRAPEHPRGLCTSYTRRRDGFRPA